MNFFLSQEIQQAHDQLIKVASTISTSKRGNKMVEGTGGQISVSDLIAYQIGWGKCLIRWYEIGIKGEHPEMPGDGFLKWDYGAIAEHFYQKYAYDSSIQQLQVFADTVACIIEITEKEQETGNLDQPGVWPWCTLSSGKQWPLRKWIQVNTVAPYKRAAQSIKRVKTTS